MKAIARRTASTGFTHQVEMREHRFITDEPREQGGEDRGPTPQELLAASLAACTAITIEMYSKRKGWDVGEVEVEVTYEQADRQSPTTFTVVLRLPGSLDGEQRERLRGIAAKCPVHRTLEGAVVFEERVEVVETGHSTT